MSTYMPLGEFEVQNRPKSALLDDLTGLWRFLRACLAILPLILVYISNVNAEDGVPLILKWDQSTKNEDGSCLHGDPASCSRDLAGYRIYRTSAESKVGLGEPTLLTVVSAPATIYVDRGVSAGTFYRYFVTAVDTFGNESGRAKELEAVGLFVAADNDNDGKINGFDNCPLQSNPQQEDSDQDGIGDACPNGQEAPGGDCASGSDPDGDGVCDPEDNCPSMANSDQTDSDSDRIGDVCTRNRSNLRMQCLQDSNNSNSSIALGNDSQFLIVDQAKGTVSKYDIEPGTNGLVGNLNAGTMGPEGFGELEVMRTASAENENMACMMVSESQTKEISFGSQGDTFIGCYVDGDLDLDIVAYNKDRILTRFSSDGSEHESDLSKYGKLFQVACGDITGDGLDELVILHQLKKSAKIKRPQVTISIVDPRTSSLASRYIADQDAKKLVVARTSNSGRGTPCTLSKFSKSQSAISCTKGGKRKIIIPTATDFSVGSFTKNSSKQSFVILGKGSKLSLVSATGKVSAINADTMKAIHRTAEAPKLRKLRFLSCR